MASPEWQVIATHPGPFARLAANGEFTSHWSYSVRASAQLSPDSSGNSSTILRVDGTTSYGLTDWFDVGLTEVTMRTAMGDMMISAGPTMSAALSERFSAGLAVMALNGEGITIWTASSGLGVRF
jgi:hypothetical protein